jgi:hypothetical protein
MNGKIIDFAERKKTYEEDSKRYSSGDFMDFDDFFRYCEIHSKSEEPYFSGEHILVLFEMIVGFDDSPLPEPVFKKFLATSEKMPFPYKDVMKDFLDEIRERRDSFNYPELDMIMDIYKW